MLNSSGETSKRKLTSINSSDTTGTLLYVDKEMGRAGKGYDEQRE